MAGGAALFEIVRYDRKHKINKNFSVLPQKPTVPESENSSAFTKYFTVKLYDTVTVSDNQNLDLIIFSVLWDLQHRAQEFILRSVH